MVWGRGGGRGSVKWSEPRTVGAEIVFLKMGDLEGGKTIGATYGRNQSKEIKNQENQKQSLAISRITVMQNSKSGSKKC